MKTIRKEIKNNFTEDIFPCDFAKDMTFAFFDLETTGLSAKRGSYIILSGIIIATCGSEKAEFVQFFAENAINDEKEIIKQTLEIINSVDTVVTYNGASFDIPFLNTRCKRYRLPEYDGCNLDIYRYVRNFSDLGTMLPNLKQKTIEAFLGKESYRKDMISGKESVELYNHYIETGDPTVEKIILLHNADDIIQLSQLIRVLSYTDFFAGLMKYGFPIKNAGNVSNVKIGKTSIVIKGNMKYVNDYICYETASTPYTLEVENNSFTWTIPTIIEEDHLFIDALSISKELPPDIPNVESGYLLIKDNLDIYNLTGLIKFISHSIRSFDTATD